MRAWNVALMGTGTAFTTGDAQGSEPPLSLLRRGWKVGVWTAGAWALSEWSEAWWMRECGLYRRRYGVKSLR